MTEKLLGFLAMGFTAFNLTPVGAGTDEQIERLGREDLPAIRAAGTDRNGAHT